MKTDAFKNFLRRFYNIFIVLVVSILLFGVCDSMKYCVVHKNVFCFWKKMSGVDGMIAPLLVSRISGKTLDRAGSNKSPLNGKKMKIVGHSRQFLALHIKPIHINLFKNKSRWIFNEILWYLFCYAEFELKN